MTIHALLHIPHYIRQVGPLWASWAFIMERFCGHLLPAVKNRVQPYEHLDNYVQRRAQMQIVSCVYKMPSLARPRFNYSADGGEMLTSREVMYPDCKLFYYIYPLIRLLSVTTVPTIVLGAPINRNVDVPQRLTNEFTKYFGVVCGGQFRAAALRERIKWDTLVRYGRFRLVGDGDKIRVADLITRDPKARDNSFVRVSFCYNYLYFARRLFTNHSC